MASAEGQVRRLEVCYPWIEWREPVMVRLADGSTRRYGCRICVALRGLKAGDVGNLPDTLEAFQEHMKTEHPMMEDRK